MPSIQTIIEKERKIICSFEMNLGEVECKKDTSEILRASFLPYLNERLKKIVKYERDGSNKIKKDSTIYAFRRLIDGKYVTQISFKSTSAEGEEFVRERPLRFIVMGDLAFYAVILAAPFHCHLCRLKKFDWEKHPNEKGPARSLQWPLNNWHKAKEGKGGRVCGVIEQPLLDAPIDPSRFVVPPFHSMLGVANSILNDFKIFIDLLLEDAPPELKRIRNSELMAEKALNEKRQMIADFGTLNGPSLARCHETMEEVLTLQHSMVVAGEETGEERAAIMEELAEVESELNDLMTKRHKLVAEEALLCMDWKRKKAKLSCFLKTKEGKKYMKPVKAHFEASLRKFGIDYAAYHGGDLVGNNCRRLMSRAEEIFAELEAVLLAVASERWKHLATKEAISSHCAAIQNALVVFDSVFSIVNKPNAKVKMDNGQRLAVVESIVG